MHLRTLATRRRVSFDMWAARSKPGSSPPQHWRAACTTDTRDDEFASLVVQRVRAGDPSERGFEGTLVAHQRLRGDELSHARLHHLKATSSGSFFDTRHVSMHAMQGAAARAAAHEKRTRVYFRTVPGSCGADCAREEWVRWRVSRAPQGMSPCEGQCDLMCHSTGGRGCDRPRRTRLEV